MTTPTMTTTVQRFLPLKRYLVEGSDRLLHRDERLAVVLASAYDRLAAEHERVREALAYTKALFLLVINEGVILDSIPSNLHHRMFKLLTPHGIFVTADLSAARTVVDKTALHGAGEEETKR